MGAGHAVGGRLRPASSALPAHLLLEVPLQQVLHLRPGVAGPLQLRGCRRRTSSGFMALAAAPYSSGGEDGGVAHGDAGCGAAVVADGLGYALSELLREVQELLLQLERRRRKGHGPGVAAVVVVAAAAAALAAAAVVLVRVRVIRRGGLGGGEHRLGELRPTQVCGGWGSIVK